MCIDCIWIGSCNSFKKVDEMRDRRNNPGHLNDIFEAIIVTCSNKNYDRSYKMGNDKGMYYCPECQQMHHDFSRIGRLHKKIP